MRKSNGAGGSASQYLVIAVDDDPRIRGSLRNLFESALIEARTLASGEEALLLLDHENAGCLIKDIRMPGMDGWELQRRAHLVRPELPII